MVLRIFKMIATSGFLTALECTKFVFIRGSARTHWGSLQRSPEPLAGLRGPTSKGGEGSDRGKKRRKEEEGNGRDCPPPFRKFLDPPLAMVDTTQMVHTI